MEAQSSTESFVFLYALVCFVDLAEFHLGFLLGILSL